MLIYDTGGGASLKIEDGIFEVTATVGGAHLGTEDFNNQIVDVHMQGSIRKNRGKDLGGNHPAIRRVGTQRDGVKRTVSSSKQATAFKELNMGNHSPTKDHLINCEKDKTSIRDRN